MVSRTSESEVATELIYEGGVLQSKRPIASPVGTTIEVRDLFFNTPARRKFLKAESTESRHLSRTATALALARYDVAFSYTLNGRQIFSVPAGTLRDRVAALLGYGKQLLEIHGSNQVVRVEGYIGKPDQATNNRWGHYIFINGRYIHSTTFSHALSAGFGEMLPKGQYPVGAVLLAVEPTEVDVNVHPAKTEVRLSKEREIYDAIFHAVREATRQDGVIPVFQAGQSQQQSRAISQGRTGGFEPPGRQTFIPGITSHAILSHEQLADLYRPPSVTVSDSERQVLQVDKETGEIIESAMPQTADSPSLQPPDSGPSEGIRLVGRFSDLYLLLQAGEDLYIVDQHTAHERVLYEEMLRRVEQHSIVGQQLLMPVQFELTPERFAIFVESESLINQSGFSVAPFGGRMISIEAVPMVLSRKSPEIVLTKVLDDIGSLTKGGYDLKKAIAQSTACRAAVMAGDRLTDHEATGLLLRLLQCENMYSCPHGRPTFIKINRGDLDRQFGRC
jgi:DNA mismatch repair protein MutL